jgi:hypothetical protein
MSNTLANDVVRRYALPHMQAFGHAAYSPTDGNLRYMYMYFCAMFEFFMQMYPSVGMSCIWK